MLKALVVRMRRRSTASRIFIGNRIYYKHYFCRVREGYYSKEIREAIWMVLCLKNPTDFNQSDFLSFTVALLQSFFAPSSQPITLISPIFLLPFLISLIYLQDIDKILNPIFVIILIPPETWTPSSSSETTASSASNSPKTFLPFLPPASS